MSQENVDRAIRLMSALPLDDLAGAMRDPRRLEEMGSTWEAFVAPEFEVMRIGPEYMGDGVSYRGLDGFLAFWTDWLEPWESYRIETEGYLDAGDKVVQLARQTGRTEAHAAPVESEGAAVLTFRDGRVARIEFHLDRDRAMKAAGLAE